VELYEKMFYINFDYCLSSYFTMPYQMLR